MVGWEGVLEHSMICVVQGSWIWGVVSWSGSPCGRIHSTGLSGLGDGALSVHPQVLEALAVVSKLWHPHVMDAVGTVAVKFQATAGNWYFLGGLQMFCRLKVDNHLFNRCSQGNPRPDALEASSI